MKFRTKLLLSYFLLALVPPGMYTGYSYNTVSATVLERYARLQFQSGADLKAAELKARQG